MAEKYPDDKDRSKAMGIALGGSAVGVLGKDNSNLCSLICLFSFFYIMQSNTTKEKLFFFKKKIIIIW